MGINIKVCLRIVGFIIAYIFCAALSNCSYENCGRIGKGRIIILGEKSVNGVYYPNLDSISFFNETLPEYNPRLICRGPQKSIFAIGKFADTLSIYQSTLEDSIIEIVSLINIPRESKFRSMDYCENSQEFIFGGNYEGKSGIFVFDSSLKFVRKFGDSCACEIAAHNPVMFLGDSAIVCRCGDDTYTINLSTDSCSITTDGWPIAISNDGDEILIIDDSYQYRVYNIRNARSINLPLNTNIYSASFSPDGNYLAFITRKWSMGRLNKYDYLMIFDIENENLCETDISAEAPTGIRLLWID